MPDNDDTDAAKVNADGPAPKLDKDTQDGSARVLADLNASSDEASDEYSRVMGRQHSEREALEARIAMTNAHYFVATKKAHDALSELAKKRLDGMSMQALEPLRLIADSKRYQAQFLGNEVDGYRRELADLLARELTDANVEAARAAAGAARTTARATVWLVIATGVLIVVTLVAAIIAAS